MLCLWRNINKQRATQKREDAFLQQYTTEAVLTLITKKNDWILFPEKLINLSQMVVM